MHVAMLDHIGHEIAPAFAAMVAGAIVLYRAEGAFDQVDRGTGGRQTEPLQPGVLGHPWLDGFRLTDLIVIHHHLDPLVVRGRISVVQARQPLPEQRIGRARPQTVVHDAGRQLQGPRQIVLLMGPRTGVTQRR